MPCICWVMDVWPNVDIHILGELFLRSTCFLLPWSAGWGDKEFLIFPQPAFTKKGRGFLPFFLAKHILGRTYRPREKRWNPITCHLPWQKQAGRETRISSLLSALYGSTKRTSNFKVSSSVCLTTSLVHAPSMCWVYSVQSHTACQCTTA